MKYQRQPENCQQGIARILTRDGKYLGAGALSTNGCLVTCSHIIWQFLNLQSCVEQPPLFDGAIIIDFPFLDDEGKVYNVEIAKGGWGPKRGWSHENNIAILKVMDEPPLDTGYLFNPIVLKHPINSLVYGFTSSDCYGAEVIGTLGGTRNIKGLQVFDSENSAFKASKGFCGGILFPTDMSLGVPQAQGMLTWCNDNHSLLKEKQSERIAYIIPAVRICSQLDEVYGYRRRTGHSIPYDELPLEADNDNNIVRVRKKYI